MAIFNGYWKIIKKNIGMVILYIVVFLMMTIMMVSGMSEKEENAYKAERLSVTVIDEDRSSFSKALIDYLKETNDVAVEEYDKEALVRELYSEKTDMVVQIPEGFEKSLPDNSMSLKVTGVPDSASGILLEHALDDFVRTASSYISAGYDMDEAIEKTAECTSVKADVSMVSSDASVKAEDQRSGYYYVFRVMPYVYISALIYVVCYVQIAFSGKELKRRIRVAPISSVRQTSGELAAFSLLFLAFFVITMCTPFLTGSRDFYTSDFMWWHVANAFMLLLSSAALAFLVGNLVHGYEAVSAVANSVSLGMCFLCGAFVPLEYLGDGVVSVARFLPVYWYERVNETLNENNVLDAADMSLIGRSFGIQVIIAAVLFCAAFLITKKKQQEK